MALLPHFTKLFSLPFLNNKVKCKSILLLLNKIDIFLHSHEPEFLNHIISIFSMEKLKRIPGQWQIKWKIYADTRMLRMNKPNQTKKTRKKKKVVQQGRFIQNAKPNLLF